MPREPRASFRAALEENLHRSVTLSFGDKSPGDYEWLIAGRPREEDCTRSESLRAVLIPYAGVPESTRTRILQSPHIALYNIHHNAAPTAEMALTLMLCAAKNILPADRALRRGDWRIRYEEDEAPLLTGRRALVLGYGAIGRRIAAMCAALGMSVEAVRRRIAEPMEEGGIGVHPVTSLDSLLENAEVLVVCLPHTPDTEGLLGEERIGRLPHGAVLINVARGSIVDEASLYYALRDRRLGAAGLDVWWRYPEDVECRRETAPSRFPFGDLDNVVLSPHRAGHTAVTETLRARHVADVLNAAAAGEKIPHRVDPEAGY